MSSDQAPSSPHESPSPSETPSPRESPSPSETPSPRDSPSPHDSPLPRESPYPSDPVSKLPLVLVKLIGQIQLLLDDAVPGNTTQHNLHWQVWVEKQVLTISCNLQVILNQITEIHHSLD